MGRVSWWCCSYEIRHLFDAEIFVMSFFYNSVLCMNSAKSFHTYLAKLKFGILMDGSQYLIVAKISKVTENVESHIQYVLALSRLE
jgi:hypothetical protein